MPASLEKQTARLLETAARQLEQGKLPAAEKSARDALAISPADLPALAMLARCRMMAGDGAGAQQALQQALAVDPELPDAHSLYGQLFLSVGRTQDALTAFTRTVELDPTHVEGRINLATLLMQDGKLDEAVQHLDKAIAVNNGVPEAHFFKGECFRAQRRAVEAAAAYGEAARLYPAFFEAQMNLGLMRRASNDFEGAVLAFRKAKSLSPKYAEAKNQLGLALIECGDYINGLKEIGAATGYIEFRNREPEHSRLSVVNRMDIRMQDKRQHFETAEHPHFIGCWNGIDPDICAGLIDFFDLNAGLQKDGRVSGGKVNEEAKKSTDIRIEPNDLKKPGYEIFTRYFDQLQDCYRDYCDQWEFLNTFIERIHIGAFNMQKYEVGGHFSLLHSERTSLTKLHRILVWMTYLNDVTDAGETEFPYYDLKVAPETGKTLIWPAEWTHMHRGCPSGSQVKYIITGWFNLAD